MDKGSCSVLMKRCSKYFDKVTIFGVNNVILIRALLAMFHQNVSTYPYFDFIGDNIRGRYRPRPYLGGKRCSSGQRSRGDWPPQDQLDEIQQLPLTLVLVRSKESNNPDQQAKSSWGTGEMY